MPLKDRYDSFLLTHCTSRKGSALRRRSKYTYLSSVCCGIFLKDYRVTSHRIAPHRVCLHGVPNSHAKMNPYLFGECWAFSMLYSVGTVHHSRHWSISTWLTLTTNYRSMLTRYIFFFSVHMSHGELALSRYTVHALIATSTVYSLLCLQYNMLS